MIAGGVSFGAPRPNGPLDLVARHEIGDGRQVGQQRRARRRGHRQRADLAAFDVRDRGRHGVEHELHLAADQVGHRIARAAVRHVHHVDAGHHLELLARHVDAGADAGRGEVELAGIGLGVGDQFRDGLDRQVVVHDHHVGRARRAGDRRDVAQEIEVQVLVERVVDHVARHPLQQRVAVRAAPSPPTRCRRCRRRRRGSRPAPSGRSAPTAIAPSGARRCRSRCRPRSRPRCGSAATDRPARRRRDDSGRERAERPAARLQNATARKFHCAPCCIELGSSFRLDVRDLDHLGPFFVFVGGKLENSATDIASGRSPRSAIRCQFGIGDASIDFPIQPFDYSSGVPRGAEMPTKMLAS